MPSFVNNPGRKRSPIPIEYETVSTANPQIPPGAIGFTYVLCGGGGGGGHGGETIGGGGGGAGEFVTGTIVLSELADLFFGSSMSLTRQEQIDSIKLIAELGQGGPAGDFLDTNGCGISGLCGQDSPLIARCPAAAVPEKIIAIARGGYPGMGGNPLEGWSRSEAARTYTEKGGIGISAIKNEARSIVGSPLFAELNRYGNGGNGGDRASPGESGLPGYFSIAFY
ncbi:MAG: hypothetical protein ACRC62_19995 [Microcoleus sp.]